MSQLAQKFDQRKALHVLLYVASRLPHPANIYNVLKCIWFADREHLEQYGRQIYGETYFAPEHGPVPSGAYDIVKYAAGRSSWDLRFPEALEAMNANNTEVSARIEPDLDLLSRSELICLTNAAKKYGKLSFGKLKTLSHQSKAFRNAGPNGEINLEALIRELHDGKDIERHILDRHPGVARA